MRETAGPLLPAATAAAGAAAGRRGSGRSLREPRPWQARRQAQPRRRRLRRWSRAARRRRRWSRPCRDDLGEDAGGGSGHFHRHLVGLEFDQRLIGLDRIAGLLEPLADGRLGNGLAQRGHADLGHCVRPLRGLPQTSLGPDVAPGARSTECASPHRRQVGLDDGIPKREAGRGGLVGYFETAIRRCPPGPPPDRRRGPCRLRLGLPEGEVRLASLIALRPRESSAAGRGSTARRGRASAQGFFEEGLELRQVLGHQARGGRGGRRRGRHSADAGWRPGLLSSTHSR